MHISLSSPMDCNKNIILFTFGFLIFFCYTVIRTWMIMQLLKFNIKSNILVKQLLNLVIFHLASYRPYLLMVFLLLLGFFCSFSSGFLMFWMAVTEALLCLINSTESRRLLLLFQGSDYWQSFLAGLSGNLTPAIWWDCPKAPF